MKKIDSISLQMKSVEIIRRIEKDPTLKKKSKKTYLLVLNWAKCFT